MLKLFFPFFILLILNLTGCTKCIKCTAVWTDPIDTNNTQLINAYEYCGNSKELKGFENEWTAQFSDTIYSEVKCE
jgi:hypothetical protein